MNGFLACFNSKLGISAFNVHKSVSNPQEGSSVISLPLSSEVSWSGWTTRSIVEFININMTWTDEFVILLPDLDKTLSHLNLYVISLSLA